MRLCIVLLSLLSVVLSLPEPQTFLWNPKDLVSLKTKVLNNDPSLMPIVKSVDNLAKALLQQTAWSVMDKKFIPPSGDKHDYMSLDKYYWPCNVNPNSSEPITAPPVCNNATGLPYIQHDGYTNPEMHLYDHDGLEDLMEAVVNLGTAYYFTDNEDYVTKAAYFLNVYFVDPATKMNPNLNFGHFIPGVTNGSHGAVIDLYTFPEMLEAVALLRLSPKWPSDLDTSLKSWFAAYGDWLENSDLGKQEKKAQNNHGVWYDVQTGFIALHTGNTDLASSITKEAVTTRVEKQITSNGELPQELARTKSWSYSEFCLDAFFHLGILSTWTPTNLWTAVNSRIRTALDWQFPYIELKKQWTYPQIEPFIDNCTVSEVTQCIGSYFNILRIAANVFNDATYEDQICKLPHLDCHNNVLNLWYEKKLSSKK